MAKRTPPRSQKASRYRTEAARRGKDGYTPEEHTFAAAIAAGVPPREAHRQAWPKSEGWKDKSVSERASHLCADHAIRTLITHYAEKVARAAAAAAAPKLATAADALVSASRAMQMDPRRCMSDDGRWLPVHEWPEDVRLCVDAVKYHPAGVTEVKFSSRTAARDQLLKHYGLYEADNRQRRPLEGLTDAELAERERRYQRAIDAAGSAAGAGGPAGAGEPGVVH